VPLCRQSGPVEKKIPNHGYEGLSVGDSALPARKSREMVRDQNVYLKWSTTYPDEQEWKSIRRSTKLPQMSNKSVDTSQSNTEKKRVISYSDSAQGGGRSV